MIKEIVQEEVWARDTLIHIGEAKLIIESLAKPIQSL